MADSRNGRITACTPRTALETGRQPILALLLVTLVSLCAGCGTGPHESTGATGRPAGRYVFIDGGAHKGETIAAFVKSDLYKRHPWKIIAFEANPNLIPVIPKREDLTILNKAMWIHDDGVEFYFGVGTLGGSLYASHAAATEVTTQVESVDFGQWLKKNFREDDIIHVKFDIEGAEYPILEKMLADGTIAWVDQIYVEFHSDAVDEFTPEMERKLLDGIRARGIPTEVHSMYDPHGQYFD